MSFVLRGHGTSDVAQPTSGAPLSSEIKGLDLQPTSFHLDRLRREIKPLRLHWFPRLRSTSDHAAELRCRGELLRRRWCSPDASWRAAGAGPIPGGQPPVC